MGNSCVRSAEWRGNGRRKGSEGRRQKAEISERLDSLPVPEDPFYSATRPNVSKGFYKRYVSKSDTGKVPTVMVTYATPLSQLPRDQKAYLESINVLDGPSVEIPQINLGSYLMEKLRQRQPTETALHLYKDRRISVREFIQGVGAMKSGLLNLDIESGRRILCVSDMSHHFPYLLIASSLLALPLLLINPKLLQNDHILEDVRNLNVAYIFTSLSCAKASRDFNRKLGQSIKIIILDPVPGENQEPECDNFEYGKELDEADGGGEEKVMKATVALTVWTQGRSSSPRPIHLTHFSLLSAFIPQWGPIEEGATVLGLLPHYHPFGLTTQLFPCLARGAPLTLIPALKPPALLACIQEEKVSVCLAVPPVIDFLAKSTLVLEEKLTSLRHLLSMLGPLNKHQMERLYRRFPDLVLYNGYGMCESGSLTHMTTGSRLCSASVGSLLPNVLCKIQHPERSVAMVARKGGEVCIRGPLLPPFLTQDPTQQTYVDTHGWLHTGDLGYYDERHNFFICGVIDRSEESTSTLKKVEGVRNVGMTPLKTPRVRNHSTDSDDTVSFHSDFS